MIIPRFCCVFWAPPTWFQLKNKTTSLRKLVLRVLYQRFFFSEEWGGGLKSTLRPALTMKVKILIFIRPCSSLVTTAQLISPANQQSPCPSPCHCQVLQDYFCSSLFCSFILLSFFNLLLLHFRPHSLWKSLVCIFFSALSESGSTKFRSHSPQLSSSLL